MKELSRFTLLYYNFSDISNRLFIIFKFYYICCDKRLITGNKGFFRYCQKILLTNIKLGVYMYMTIYNPLHVLSAKQINTCIKWHTHLNSFNLQRLRWLCISVQNWTMRPHYSWLDPSISLHTSFFFSFDTWFIVN